MTVYNGIALDRAGRLITNEEGNLFLNNSKYSQEVQLLDSVAKNYLMVEFTLEPVDYDQRAFWDPTYENPPVVDSGNDNVPQPKGKEFSVSVPTRKAQSWTVVVSGTGFEDAVDPNKIRIPVAIIPMTGANINLTVGTDTDFAQTTIIEQPVVGNAATDSLGYLRCADTRIFPDSGEIKLYSPVTGSERAFLPSNKLTIVSNDRENNVLYLSSVAHVDATVDINFGPRIGDVVRIETTTANGENFLSTGTKYDCRPLLFSFTDSVAAADELISAFIPGAATTGDRYTSPRNNRYWAAQALLVDPDNTTGDPTVNYPLDTTLGQYKAVPVVADRVENRLKQQQDFFRVIGALLQEMKYGVPTDIIGTASESNSVSILSGGTLYKIGIRSGITSYIVDTTKYFSESLVGSYVRSTNLGSANFGTRNKITAVLGDHVLVFTTAWTTQWTSADGYTIEKDYPNTLDATELKKYVDAKYTGTLEEVYTGRVDQFTGSYAEDLNRRLSINKVATITVGDGISTHGDFTGSGGLLAAFRTAFAKKRGAHIHIRRGTYNVSSNAPIEIGPNTVVTGEGKGATIINLVGSETLAGTTGNYFLVRDYYENYKAAAPTLAELLCSNITFKDISIRSTAALGAAFSAYNYGYPLISNVNLSFFDSPNVVDNTINPGAGVWRPNVAAGVSGFSPVENFTLENVELLGGGNGNYKTGTDVTYSVYLSTSNSNDHWQQINTGITFKGCTFDTHRGGTAILKGCRKVLVDGCEFRNRAPADGVANGGAYAPVEGITFASVAGRESFYYENTNVNSDGDVLITGCSFLGELFDSGGSTAYPLLGHATDNIGRGWVNFTPAYKGQNVEISSCIFRGDLQGDSGTTTVSGPRTTQRGNPLTLVVGILNCSPFDIKVTGCNFHTVKYGIISQIGLMDVSDCNFYNNSKSILMRPELYVAQNNFTLFSDTATDENFWTAGAASEYYKQSGITDEPPTYTKLLCKNNTFMYCTNGLVVGVYPWVSTTASPNTAPSIIINSCHFEGCASSVYWDIYKLKTNYSSVYSGTDNGLRNNWRYVEISDSSFTKCTFASRVYGELKQVVNNHHNPYEILRGPVDEFVYKNNTHGGCSYSGREWRTARTAATKVTNAGAFVSIIGTSVIFSGNSFDKVTHYEGTVGNAPHATDKPSYSTSPIALLMTAGGVTVNENTWTSCGIADQKQLTHLKVGIIGKTAAAGNDVYSFTANKIDSSSENFPGTGDLGINNGIFVNQLFPEVNDSGDLTAITTGIATEGGTIAGCGITTSATEITPELVFENNVFDLANSNFGFVAVQHQEGGYTGTANEGGFGTYGYSQYWEWNSATVANNLINIKIDNLKGGTNASTARQYGNDIGTNLLDDVALQFNNTVARPANQPALVKRYSFLGACNTSDPDFYVACFDLRRCSRGTSSVGPTSNRLTGNVSVTGNVFRVEDNVGVPKAITASTRNLQEVMAFRISKYPKVLNVKDNTFDKAPLLLRYTWNCPYMTTAKPGGISTNFFTGFAMNIDGNSFYNYNTPHTVDINPAVGWGAKATGGAADPVARTEVGFAEISFCQNSVKATSGASTVADWDTWAGGVRFWFPDSDVWGQANNAGTPANWTGGNPSWSLAAGFHSHQDYLKYKWNVNNNTLQDTYFRITKAQDGGIAATGGGTWAASSNLPAELLKNNAVVGNFSLSLWMHNTLLCSAPNAGLTADHMSLFGHNTVVAKVGEEPWTTTGGLDATGGSHTEFVVFTVGVNWAASTEQERRLIQDTGSILD